MATGLFSLFSGIMAGLKGKALTKYVLMNVALDFWTKKRRKSKNSDQSTPSSQASTGASQGNAIPVIFGLANVDGVVFDVINRKDGGYPVFGALGFCVPKSFAYGNTTPYQGVDLVDRSSVVVTENTVASGLGNTLDSFNLIIRDQVAPGAIENMQNMLKSLKWGNDASKVVNNAVCKFFNYGGFSNWGGYEEIIVADSSGSSLQLVTLFSTNSEHPYSYSGATYTRAFYLDGNSLAFTYVAGMTIGKSSFVLSNSGGPFEGQDFSSLSIGDLLRIITISGQEILTDITALSEYKSKKYRKDYYKGNEAYYEVDETKRVIHASASVTGMASAKIIKFHGKANRKPDMAIQFNATEYRSNNKLAWLAQEIRDPGSSYKNITTEVARASMLIFDGAMPACETVQIAEKANKTFKELVAWFVDPYPINIDGTWTSNGKYLCNNPIAIIYEICVNDSFGLGWSPDRLDIDSFVEAYKICYSPSTVTQSVMWKFHGYVLSNQESASSVIDEILNHIHCDRAFTPENKLKLFMNTGNVSNAKVLDLSLITIREEDSEPTANFKVSTRETNDMFNVLKISYFRPDREFLYDAFLKITDFADIQFSGTIKELQLDFPGFMEERYAKQSGLIHMARQQLEVEYYETEVDIQGQNFDVGDVVRIVAHGSDYDEANAITYDLPIDGFYVTGNVTYLAINQKLNVFDGSEQGLLYWKKSALVCGPIISHKVVNESTYKIKIQADNGISVGDVFKVYRTQTNNYRYFKCTSSTRDYSYPYPTYDIEFNFDCPEIRAGDRIAINDTDYIIEDVDYSFAPTGAPDIFSEPGVLVLKINAYIGVDITGHAFTLKRLQGLRCLWEDRFARVVEIKDSNSFKTTISLRQYSPEAYDGSSFASIVVESPKIENRILNPSSLGPRDPSFISVDVILSESGNSVVSSVVVHLQNISTPENYMTVVTLYAVDPDTDNEIMVDRRTIYSGESIIKFDGVPAYAHGTGNPIKYYADAISYNKDGLSSDRISSKDVLGGYATIGELVDKPLPVSFDESACEYSDRLKLTTKKYAGRDFEKLVIRTTDDTVAWDNTNNDASDPTFIAKGETQIIFEQKNLSTLERSLTFYLRCYNKVGLYSDLGPGSSITLVNPMPSPVNDTKYTALVVNNVAKFSIGGFDDGNGNPGSTIPKDIIGYELFLGDSTTPLFFSSSPEFEYALNFDEFNGVDTVTKTFKVLAHDRISYTFPSGEDRETRLSATSAKSVEFRRLDSAALALDVFRTGSSDNLLRLLWVTDDGVQASDYKSTFGKIMVTSATPYRQSLVLDNSTTYVLSFYAKSTAGGAVGISINGNIPSTITVTTTSTSRVLVSQKFTTNSNTGLTPQTTFSAFGAGEIYEIMLNKGEHAHVYSLHKDDELDNLGNREYKRQLAQILESINSNHAQLLAKFDENGARIDVAEDEIVIRVKKDDIMNSIMLSEEAISISGKNIIVDGLTRFMNSTDNIYGGIIESDGSTYAVLYNQSNKTNPTGLNRLYSYNKSTGLLEKEFTFTNVAINPANKRKLTLTGINTVTGSFPSVGDFVTADTGDRGLTTIDGDRITTGTITAEKILAKTIGAEKLIAKDILAQIIQVIGKNTVILSDEEGIVVYPSTAYSAPKNAKIISENKVVIFDESLSISTGDFVKISYNQGGSGSDMGVFYGMTLKTVGHETYQVSGNGPTYPVAVFWDQTPPFTGIDYESSEALITVQVLNRSAQTKYVQISAQVADPLDNGVLKPGIKIVSGSHTATWTVDNFYLDSPNSIIKSAKVEGSQIEGGNIKGVHIEGGNIDIGADLVGEPNKSFHVGSDGKLWIGSESYANAPFKVDEDGNVKAIDLDLKSVSSLPSYTLVYSEKVTTPVSSSSSIGQYPWIPTAPPKETETLLAMPSVFFTNPGTINGIRFIQTCKSSYPVDYFSIERSNISFLNRCDYKLNPTSGVPWIMRKSNRFATQKHIGYVFNTPTAHDTLLIHLTENVAADELVGMKAKIGSSNTKTFYIAGNQAGLAGGVTQVTICSSIFEGHPSSNFYKSLYESNFNSNTSTAYITKDDDSSLETTTSLTVESSYSCIFSDVSYTSQRRYQGFILKIVSAGVTYKYRIVRSEVIDDNGGIINTEGKTYYKLRLYIDTSGVWASLIKAGVVTGDFVYITDCSDECAVNFSYDSPCISAYSGFTLSTHGVREASYLNEALFVLEFAYDIPTNIL